MNNKVNDIHWYGQKTPESISLRDYFAAAALQGMMAQFDPENELEHHIAKWSYKAADAMLKAREVKP